ncbi:acetamidase [Colletotrichum tofieldiae]|nr:acetamidase [Colletotrichum tofieldiae]GKT96799.1 acetamidase [Colletotrichum tofieldiae]
MRDDSLAKISPPLKLGNLPDPLPSNVCEIRHLVLEPEEIEITSLDADEILAAIRSKKYSCVTVTKAFLRAAALAQVLTNCITELLPEMALERAALLDALPEPLGPLHGLPISVKEHHGMFGRMKTCGMVAYIDAETSGVSGVNDVLWASGAVFYARTTMPQTGMHLETSSNIYGTTLNPRNLSLTPGGSSGGEAALVAFRGSVLVRALFHVTNPVVKFPNQSGRVLEETVADRYELQLDALAYTVSNLPRVGSVVVAQELFLAETGKLLLIRGIDCGVPVV